ncbi:MAG: META domain-containing protein [Propionicimonas sp.]
MRSRSASVLLVAAVLAVTAVMTGGCSSPQGADPAELEGSWALESFGAVSGLRPADPEVTTAMTLADGKATGNGGVNSFSGTYEASKAGEVSFGPIAATKMAGPSNAMAQESAFFAALEETTGFEINGGNLVLSDLGNNTLVILAPKET